jgi:hypothetical protein
VEASSARDPLVFRFSRVKLLILLVPALGLGVYGILAQGGALVFTVLAALVLPFLLSRWDRAILIADSEGIRHRTGIARKSTAFYRVPWEDIAGLRYDYAGEPWGSWHQDMVVLLTEAAAARRARAEGLDLSEEFDRQLAHEIGFSLVSLWIPPRVVRQVAGYGGKHLHPRDSYPFPRLPERLS